MPSMTDCCQTRGSSGHVMAIDERTSMVIHELHGPQRELSTIMV